MRIIQRTCAALLRNGRSKLHYRGKRSQESFYRNAINIGLPIIECPEAAQGIEAGDEVEVDFDSGMIYNRTKGTEFKGQPFPEFMQKLIAAGGLVNYTNSKKK